MAAKKQLDPSSEEYRLDWIRRASLYALEEKQEEEILKYDDKFISNWLVGRCGRFLQYRIEYLRHEQIMEQLRAMNYEKYKLVRDDSSDHDDRFGWK